MQATKHNISCLHACVNSKNDTYYLYQRSSNVIYTHYYFENMSVNKLVARYSYLMCYKEAHGLVLYYTFLNIYIVFQHNWSSL